MITAPAGKISKAVISKDGLYRYVLSRRWGDGPVMLWLGLNPSTADAGTDDQTIRQMCWFARREGCGGICVLNLYALRSPSPAVLGAHPDPIGPENDRWLAGLADDIALGHLIDGDPVIPLVAAWGAHPLAVPRLPRVRKLLRSLPMTCLGVTRSGAPRHPCRLAHDTPAVPYEWPG